MRLEQTWLGRMWRTDKKLFVVITVYMAGVFLYALRQYEEFPFLLYGMYSLKEEPQETYRSYEITAAGQVINYTRLWDAGKELIISTTIKGLAAEQMRDLSPDESKKLREWLLRYISDMRFTEDNTLKVDELTCKYDTTGIPHITERKTRIDYAAN